LAPQRANAMATRGIMLVNTPDDRVATRLSEYRCRLLGLRHFSVWLEISFRVSAASCC
jgi:hypothetical protein